MRKYFLTGCDSNTEWQLPWFVNNFHTHCDEDLIIADFGMSSQMRNYAEENSVGILECESNGWFTKVEAMVKLRTTYSGSYCWLDTDCEVRGDPSTIFKWVEPNKLTMVVDHPWSTRRPELGHWYNSGVVAFEGSPNILNEWYKECKTGKHVGDQEALHHMLGGDIMKKAMYISEAPHKFNVLRIDLIDNKVPENIVIMHWTGQKGKLEIRKQMGL
jgi:hypothetical protein